MAQATIHSITRPALRAVSDMESPLRASLCLTEALVALTGHDDIPVSPNALNYLCGELQDRLESLETQWREAFASAP